MKGKSAIGSWQLAILLFLSRTMQFFLASPVKEQPGPVTTALLLPVSALLTGLLLVPAYCLMRRAEGKGIVDLAIQRWGKWGLLCPALYFLFSLCVLVQTSSAFAGFLTSVVYPDTSPWLFLLLLMAVGGYTAAMGYEPAARFGGFVFLAFVGAVVFAGICLWPQARLEYLPPPAYDSWQSQLRLLITLTLGNVETAALLFLIPVVNQEKKSVFWKWSLLSVAILEGVFLFTAAVLGDYAKSQRFPFYTVTKMAEVSVFQRLDSLYVALWVFMVLVRLAVFLEVGAKSLTQLLPQRASRYAVGILAALAAGCAGVLTGKPAVLERMGQVFSGGLPVVLLVGVLPLALLICHRQKGGSK